MTLKQGSKYEEDPPIISATVVADEEMPVHKPPAHNPDYQNQKIQVASAKSAYQQYSQETTKPGAVAVLPPHQAQPVVVQQQLTSPKTPTNNNNVVVSNSQQQTTTTTTYQVPPTRSNVMTTYTHLGRNPTGLECPYCKRQMVTTTKDVIGVTTIVAIIIICFLFWPLCWIPLCVPSCKRTHHFCGQPMCRAKVGETKECA